MGFSGLPGVIFKVIPLYDTVSVILLTGERRACDARATVCPPWKNRAEEEN